MEKAKEHKKQFKLDLNEIVKGKYKSEEQKSAILKFFRNHWKKLSICLMIILQLHLELKSKTWKRN